MNFKKLTKVLLTSVLTLGLVACSSGGTSSQSTTDSSSSTGTSSSQQNANDTNSSDITVGMILKTLSAEFYKYVEAGAKDAAADYGVSVIVQGPPSETSYSEQASMIETMLSAGEVDAIIVAPLQSDMAKTQLTGASIPVFFVDTDVEDFDEKVSFIGTGNEAAAYLGGEYMAELLPDDAKVVLIGGVAGNPGIEARISGYKNAMADNNIEVLDVQYADSNEEKALNVMENFLQNFERIDAVLVINDSMAMAAQRAASQAGRSEILFMGFDGISSGVEAVINGNITATTAQSPYQMGYQSVEAAVKHLNGEEVDEWIDTGAIFVDSSNAQEYLDELNAIIGN